MSNCERVCGMLARILINAGYSIDSSNHDHGDIMEALSDYSEKRDEMLEYILLEEYV